MKIPNSFVIEKINRENINIKLTHANSNDNGFFQHSEKITNALVHYIVVNEFFITKTIL